MRYTICLFCMILSGISLAGVKVIENTPQKLVLDWTLDTFSLGQTPDGHTTIVAPYPGLLAAEKNGPITSIYPLTVGVPATGNVATSIQIESQDVVALSTPLALSPENLAPLPQSGILTEPLYRTMGSMRTAKIMLAPFIYRQNETSLTVVKKARITISFPNAPWRPVTTQPLGEYNRMLSQLLINPLVAAGWYSSIVPLRKASATLPASPLSRNKFLSFAIGDGFEGFNEGTIKENGIIAITPADIAALGNNLPIRDVVLYAGQKDELPIVAADSFAIPTGVVAVPLVPQDVNSDGIFNGQDRLYACITGLSDWSYKLDKWQYNVNVFADKRQYYIMQRTQSDTLDTLLTVPFSAAGIFDTTTYFMQKTYFRRPISLPNGSKASYDRYWLNLTQNASATTFTGDFPGVMNNALSYVKVLANSSSNLEVTAGTVTMSPYIPGTTQTIPMGALTSNATISLKSLNYSLQIDGVEFGYPRMLDCALAPVMTIFVETSGKKLYRCVNVPPESLIVIKLNSTETRASALEIIRDRTTGTALFADAFTAGDRIVTVSGNGFTQGSSVINQRTPLPAGIDSSVIIRNPRTVRQAAKYIIITHDDFLPQAVRLALHKRQYGSGSAKDAWVVRTQDIYREFSGGAVDPAALRNFNQWAWYYWQPAHALQFEVLLGNGHYDIKGVASREKCMIPVMEQGSNCIESYFAAVNPGDGQNDVWPDFFLGRFTCNTPAEAATMVDKVIAMENPAQADFGSWRNRAVLVADDDRQGADIDGLGNQHVPSSEKISSIFQNQSPGTDLRKVYLSEYPWDASWEKPEAARALQNEVNNGAAYVNWFGHGSDVLWADEHILTLANIGALNNKNRYPLFTSFSCDVGDFDSPDHDCLTDALMKLSNAGACGGIASTRVAYATSNDSMGSYFFRSILDTSYTNPVGLSYCFSLAKTQLSNIIQYVLLGDPSLVYVDKNYQAQIQLISNHKDTISALERITINGRITLASDSATTISTFGNGSSTGQALISIFSPPEISPRKDGGNSATFSYTMPGSPVYTGTVAVVNGVFSQNILLPKNVKFDIAGARITAYAWTGTGAQATGAKKILFHGTDTSDITDVAGPTIAVRPVYSDIRRASMATFTDRITVGLPAQIEIRLNDVNGIDVISTAPDEGLLMEIPGVLAKQNINSKYRFDQGAYQQGSAVISFDNGALSPGTYQLKISAGDLLGNRTRQTIALEIQDTIAFSLDRLFAFPNPIRKGESTKFYFYTSLPSLSLSSNDYINVSIKIYTLSGRLLRVLNAQGGVANGVTWDGRDEAGNQLGPNIYLYQATAVNHGYWNPKNSAAKSAIGKLVIHPPAR